MGKDAKKYRFDDVLSTLYFVKSCENKTTDKISVRTHSLLTVYLVEKDRYERIVDWKREQERKSGS